MMGKILSYSYIDRNKREHGIGLEQQKAAAPDPRKEGEGILDRFFDRVIIFLSKFILWYGIPFTLYVLLAALGLWVG
jgi:hypothetical protein